MAKVALPSIVTVRSSARLFCSTTVPESPLTVAELGRRLSLEPATLSPLLKRLEASGMVTRDRDPRDVRALAVSLTARGRRTRSRAERIPPAILDRLDMSLDELEELRDGLTQLIEASRAGCASPVEPTRR